jgi:hypothetical protein
VPPAPAGQPATTADVLGHSGEPAAVEPGPAEGAPAPGLAGAAVPLSIRVTSVGRVGAGVLEVRVAFRNAGTVPARLRPAEADGDREGALAATFLEDADGRFRTAVLRDGRGEALCSADPGEIPAGAERQAWLRFAVDGRDAHGLFVHLPGLPRSPLTPAGG